MLLIFCFVFGNSNWFLNSLCVKGTKFLKKKRKKWIHTWYIGLFQAFISGVQFFPYHILHHIHALLFPLRYSQVYADQPHLTKQAGLQSYLIIFSSAQTLSALRRPSCEQLLSTLKQFSGSFFDQGYYFSHNNILVRNGQLGRATICILWGLARGLSSLYN